MWLPPPTLRGVVFLAWLLLKLSVTRTACK
jgi:hypothetical protein